MNLEAELMVLLERFTAAQEHGDRIDSWVALHEWTRTGFSTALLLTDTAPLSAKHRHRTLILLDVLAKDETLRARFLDSFEAMLSKTHGINLFAEAGIADRRGFWAELWTRVYGRVLPEPRDDGDLESILRRQYASEAQVARFLSIGPEDFHLLVGALYPPERKASWAPIRRDFADAFRLLATRVQAEGLSDLIRMRAPLRGIEVSPFFRLARASENFLMAWETGKPIQDGVQGWDQTYRECQVAMAEIRKNLQTGGVSTDIVFGLRVISLSLARMKIMVQILETAPGPERSEIIHKFMGEVLSSSLQDRSVSELLKSTTQLLHRTIVERSGESGEHYIATDRNDYRHILIVSAGGGLVTALTAAVKMAVHEKHLPPFVEGFAYGLNYAVSFLILGAFGLMLATKQPAMTAARLAAIMKEHTGKQRVDRIADFTVRIVHSQLGSAMANVLAVTIGAFGLDHLWRFVTGSPFLHADGAGHTYLTLSPFHSGTIFFAALTGVILFASSVIGGWFDNWSVFHRLPESIAQAMRRRGLDAEDAERLSGHIRRQMGPWMTSISLGFLLGFTPIIGMILGIPLDVRHVTLSTGTLALSAATLGGSWLFGGWFWSALAGIATMFVLNLSVSFFLSLYTAARAYSLPEGEIRELLRRLFWRLLKSPLDFILPTRAATTPTQVETP